MAFYVMRKGSEFRIANTDQQRALKYHEDGWELGPRPYDTRGEAEAEMSRWKKRFDALKSE